MAARKTATAKRNGKPAGLRGAPRKFDRATVVKTICERLETGKEPMAVICRDMGVPVRTVNEWRENDAAIAACFTEAFETGMHALASECLRIADTPLEGEETTTKPDGTVETKRGDMLGHRKLQIETRLKLLAKWAYALYGDKQHMEHSGSLSLESIVAGTGAGTPE